MPNQIKLILLPATIVFLGISSAVSCPSPDRTLTEQMKAEMLERPSEAVTEATVTIEAFQFSPNNIVLKKGGKITFINKDSTPHTVTPDPEAQFIGTGRLAKDESKTAIFDKVGVQTYFCEIHPSMMGKITVVE
jgi:plastocyanin